jgi:hypothetical protein
MYPIRHARGHRLALASVLAGALAALGVYWALASDRPSDRPASMMITTEADAIAMATAGGEKTAPANPTAGKPAATTPAATPAGAQPAADEHAPALVKPAAPEPAAAEPPEPDPVVITAVQSGRPATRPRPPPIAPPAVRSPRGGGGDASPEPSPSIAAEQGGSEVADAAADSPPLVASRPVTTPVAPAASARIALPTTQQGATQRAPRPSLPSRVAPDARAAIESLSVDGSLSDAEVRRGVERVRSRLDACYRAAGAVRSGVQVSFVVDEAGRASQVRATGGANGLSACITDVISSVRTRVAPDVGDVRVSLRVGPARGAE